MNKIRKIFTSINMTWPRLIIFAILAGIYTAVMMIIPITKDTSFRDLGTTFEVWIFFGILIIMNSKSAKDSALKCFIFFLISQPIIYLLQVPFSWQGWRLFGYYKYWFIWTLLCLPMGYIGYYLKDNKWYGLLILTPMIMFTVFEFLYYIGDVIGYFPNHLLTCIFCVVACIVYSISCFENKKLILIELTITILLFLAASIISFNKGANTYETLFFIQGVTLKEDTKVYLKDSKYGTLKVEYVDNLEEYAIKANFTDIGETEIVVELEDGEVKTYPIDVKRTSYEIKYDNPREME